MGHVNNQEKQLNEQIYEDEKEEEIATLCPILYLILVRQYKAGVTAKQLDRLVENVQLVQDSFFKRLDLSQENDNCDSHIRVKKQLQNRFSRQSNCDDDECESLQYKNYGIKQYRSLFEIQSVIYAIPFLGKFFYSKLIEVVAVKERNCQR